MKQNKSTLKKERISTRKLKPSSAPIKSDSALSKTLVIAGIAIVILLGVVLYHLGTTGQATKVQDTPSPASYNLDVNSEQDINVDTLSNVNVTLTASGEKEAKEYTLRLTKNDDGSLDYNLGGYQERITETVGGGDVYVDTVDDIADLKVSYAAPYFHIKNLNFKEPDDVKITLLNESLAEIAGNFVSVASGTKVVLLFNASSSAQPDLSVAWANGTEFTAEELTDTVTNGEATVDETLGTAEKFVTKKLEWTPTIAGANVLLVKGKIGDKETTKRYVIAVDNVVYELNEKTLPKVYVQKWAKGNVEVTLTFSDKAQMQPFSLPCGVVDLSDQVVFHSDLVNVISSYHGSGPLGNIWQWTPQVPSELTKLEPNKGYFLQRKAGAKGDIVLSVTCPPPLAPPTSIQTFNQPVLKKGWNLIGISGYEPIAVETLSKKIILLYALDNLGAENIDPSATELLPGQAYWVMVQ